MSCCGINLRLNQSAYKEWRDTHNQNGQSGENTPIEDSLHIRSCTQNEGESKHERGRGNERHKGKARDTPDVHLRNS